MSRQLPNSREEAFAYQFEEDVKLLLPMGLLSKEGFKKQLGLLQARIDAYNNLDLQKSCEDAAKKYEANKKYMIEKYNVNI